MYRLLLNISKKNLITKTLVGKYSTLNSAAIEHLSSIVGSSNYSVSEAVRTHHSKDESLHEYKFNLNLKLNNKFNLKKIREAHPDVVVFPQNTDQISKVLQFCNKNNIPAIPYGAGSGFEGGINAIKVKFNKKY